MHLDVLFALCEIALRVDLLLEHYQLKLFSLQNGSIKVHPLHELVCLFLDFLFDPKSLLKCVQNAIDGVTLALLFLLGCLLRACVAKHILLGRPVALWTFVLLGDLLSPYFLDGFLLLVSKACHQLLHQHRLVERLLEQFQLVLKCLGFLKIGFPHGVDPWVLLQATCVMTLMLYLLDLLGFLLHRSKSSPLFDRGLLNFCKKLGLHHMLILGVSGQPYAGLRRWLNLARDCRRRFVREFSLLRTRLPQVQV